MAKPKPKEMRQEDKKLGEAETIHFVQKRKKNGGKTKKKTTNLVVIVGEIFKLVGVCD